MDAPPSSPPVRTAWHRATLGLAAPYPALAVLLLSHGGTVPVSISALTLGCAMVIPLLMYNFATDTRGRPCPHVLLGLMIVAVSARLTYDALQMGVSPLLLAFVVTAVATVAAAFQERTHLSRLRRHRQVLALRAAAVERAERWVEAELADEHPVKVTRLRMPSARVPEGLRAS